MAPDHADGADQQYAVNTPSLPTAATLAAFAVVSVVYAGWRGHGSALPRGEPPTP